MILKCNKERKSGSITIGREYLVVCVSFNIHSQKVNYNIVDDFGRLAFYDDDFFDIVDNSIETDWVFSKISSDFFEILPKVLSYKSFYVDFHDDEPQARQKFKERFPELAAKLI